MTISLKTGQLNVWYFNLYSFSRHSDSSVTQHLAALNKILFTKGGFSGIKYTKIVFVFGGALLRARYPAGGATTLLQAPPSPVDWQRGCLLPIPLPPPSIRPFDVRSYDHLATPQSHHHITSGGVTAKHATSTSHVTMLSRQHVILKLTHQRAAPNCARSVISTTVCFICNFAIYLPVCTNLAIQVMFSPHDCQ